jgi:hypothetical protein
MARKTPITARPKSPVDEHPTETTERPPDTTEHLLEFEEAFALGVMDVVRPLRLRQPGTVIPTDRPGLRAIGAWFQWLSDQVSDLRREIDQLRIKGRRVPSKEALFEGQMNKVLQVYGLDRKARLEIFKIYNDLYGSRASKDAMRQRRSRAASR